MTLKSPQFYSISTFAQQRCTILRQVRRLFTKDPESSVATFDVLVDGVDTRTVVDLK